MRFIKNRKAVRWLLAVLLILLWLLAVPKLTFTDKGRIDKAVRQLRARDTGLRKVSLTVWEWVPGTLVQHLIRFAPESAKELHLNAVGTLTHYAPKYPSAVRGLALAVGHGNLLVRHRAMEGLKSCGSGGFLAIDTVIHLQPRIPFFEQNEVFETLAAIGPNDPRVFSMFLAALTKSDLSEVAASQMVKVIENYDDEARPRLCDLFEQPASQKPEVARVILRMQPGSSETDVFLSTCLKHTNAAVGFEAAKVIAEWKNTKPKFIPGLHRILAAAADPPLVDPHSRSFPKKPLKRGNIIAEVHRYRGGMATIEALANAGSDAHEALSLLKKICAESDPITRMKVGRAIWRISNEDEPLRKILEEILKNPEERLKGMDLLASLTPEWAGAIEYWSLLLNDSDKGVRFRAIEKLENLGNAARLTLPLLKQRLSDPNDTIRTTVPRVIATIQDEARR